MVAGIEDVVGPSGRGALRIDVLGVKVVDDLDPLADLRPGAERNRFEEVFSHLFGEDGGDRGVRDAEAVVGPVAGADEWITDPVFEVVLEAEEDPAAAAEDAAEGDDRPGEAGGIGEEIEQVDAAWPEKRR